jgi:hypothetical protein
MRHHSAEYWTRRAFLGGLTLAGTAGLLGLHCRTIAAEPPPETMRLRLLKVDTICQEPLYVAEELLRSEGFTEVQYVGPSGEAEAALTSGEVDLAMRFGGPLLLRLDVGDPIVILAGGHIGCLELFGTDRIRTIRDLKCKTIAVSRLGSPGQRLHRHHGGPRGSRCPQGHPLGGVSCNRVEASVGGRQDRRGHALATIQPRASGAGHRARRGQQRPGPSLVAVFLPSGHSAHDRTYGRPQTPASAGT